MNKVIFLLVVAFGLGMITSGALMPQIPNFFLQKTLVIEGIANVPGTFTCMCKPMPPCPVGNPTCEPEVCDADDFGTVSTPGPYFNSAAICGFTPPP